jgi:hypothetical protein
MGNGNLMVTFYPEEFDSFRKLVKDLKRSETACRTKETKAHCITHTRRLCTVIAEP